MRSSLHLYFSEYTNTTTGIITQEVQSAEVLYSCITKPVDELTTMQATVFYEKTKI
jgi:hypothetical protein